MSRIYPCPSIMNQALLNQIRMIQQTCAEKMKTIHIGKIGGIKQRLGLSTKKTPYKILLDKCREMISEINYAKSETGSPYYEDNFKAIILKIHNLKDTPNLPAELKRSITQALINIAQSLREELKSELIDDKEPEVYIQNILNPDNQAQYKANFNSGN